jgi:hypothetical protein
MKGLYLKQHQANPLTKNAFRIRVSKSALLDEHLSPVDTCQVVGTMHVYKYWPLVRFAATVGKCDASQRNHQCRNAAFSRFIYTWQAGKWLVDGQYHPVLWMAKYTSRGNAIRMTRQTFGKYLPNKCVVKTVWQLFTWLSCTADSCWCICVTNQS